MILYSACCRLMRRLRRVSLHFLSRGSAVLGGPKAVRWTAGALGVPLFSFLLAQEKEL